jgi:enoyl-CoA hydratase/carnithine racemase
MIAPSEGREGLDAATASLVDAVLAAPPQAVRALKPLLRSAVTADRVQQLAAEREAQTPLILGLLSAPTP